MQKLIPCLWFESEAEEAANFYKSIFKDVKIVSVLRRDELSAKASGMPEGSVLTVEFELFGQQFLALNGGPVFKFTPAISFIVYCDTQREIDDYWDKLSAGGQIMECGWLTDKYGLSWQIITPLLIKYLKDKDAARAKRVMEAMLQMVKIDIKKLEDAYHSA